MSLAQTHDTLLIDNWRMLHARSPILPGRESRAIERVYLEALH
nr:TauD/TfdA family dioxygenase [Mesorhizobium sp.]